MRVTNQMVTSSSLRNMQKTMQHVSNLNQQITTGKKISTPSEDPVIAIRALKLRTTCAQLKQYKDRNIKDALNWVDITQDSIENIYNNLEDVYYICVHGSQDTNQTDDRNTLIDNLLKIKEAIYQEGGQTYAGRYLLSGYKTDTNMVFQDDAAKEGLAYNITESISPEKITVKNVVLNGTDPSKLDDYLAPVNRTEYVAPETASVYRIKLAYDNLDQNASADIYDEQGKQISPFSFTITGDDGVTVAIDPAAGTITATDANGDPAAVPGWAPTQVNTMDPAHPENYYDVADGEINYIPETGELVFGKDVYNQIKTASDITVNYNKSDFKVNDLRPEMYFNCTQYKETLDGIEPTNFTVSDKGQPIQYEVNFSQYVTVNVEGKDVITHEMGNQIDEMAAAVQDVLDIEDTIEKLKSMLNDPQYMNDEDAVAQINRMLEGADIELALKREKMQKLFGNNITNFQNHMEDVSAVQARVGTTYSRLELIQTRVTEQLANFDDLRSANEDVEAEEVAIEMYQAELAYNTALATTASVVQKTLLDYL